MSNKKQVYIIGGGAAGFFAAITCAEVNPNLSVTILERGKSVLEKVRISGAKHLVCGEGGSRLLTLH